MAVINVVKWFALIDLGKEWIRDICVLLKGTLKFSWVRILDGRASIFSGGDRVSEIWRDTLKNSTVLLYVAFIVRREVESWGRTARSGGVKKRIMIWQPFSEKSIGLLVRDWNRWGVPEPMLLLPYSRTGQIMCGVKMSVFEKELWWKYWRRALGA